jgi:hypothetical protein
MFPPAMYPVPNFELYSATLWAQSSLGASSIWSIPMSNWMGPAGDSNIFAADGNRALALPRFRLVAVRYHCGGWSEEVNSCISILSYMVYL